MSYEETKVKTLTWSERLILANQFEILSALAKTKLEKEHFEKSKEIVENGFEIFYSSLNASVSDESISAEEGEEVQAILSMYRDLIFSFGKLEDKTGIDAYKINFPGFDGNNEFSHYSFATFLIEREGKYEPVVMKNSHGPFLSKYRRMLEVYEPMMRAHARALDNCLLAADEIKAILAA